MSHPWVEDHAAILRSARICVPAGAHVSDFDILRIVSAAAREIVNLHPKRSTDQLLSILQIGPAPQRVDLGRRGMRGATREYAGMSAEGKSFRALEMACAIAEAGENVFDRAYRRHRQSWRGRLATRLMVWAVKLHCQAVTLISIDIARGHGWAPAEPPVLTAKQLELERRKLAQGTAYAGPPPPSPAPRASRPVVKAEEDEGE